MSEAQVSSEAISHYLSLICRVESITAKTVAAHNRMTAAPFSCMDYIWLDENMSSRILRDLLDPKGKYQGCRFTIAASTYKNEAA